MDKLIGLTVILALAVGLMVPKLEELADSQTAAGAATVVGTETTPDDGPHGYRAEIVADARGHFVVDAELSGRSLTMLADTGATVVALRRSDARALGVEPLPGAESLTISTANGAVRAVRLTLDEIRVSGVVVRDVEAVVLPDEALSIDLLGMSFFKRLARFEVADGRLRLEQ